MSLEIRAVTEVAIGNRARPNVALHNLNQIEPSLSATAVKPKEKWSQAVEGQKEQEERPLQHRNTNPAYAIGTRVIKGCGDHRELVLVTELLKQPAVTTAHWVCGEDMVVEDGYAHISDPTKSELPVSGGPGVERSLGAVASHLARQSSFEFDGFSDLTWNGCPR